MANGKTRAFVVQRDLTVKVHSFLKVETQINKVLKKVYWSVRD